LPLAKHAADWGKNRPEQSTDYEPVTSRHLPFMPTILPDALAGHGRDDGEGQEKAMIGARGRSRGDQPHCQAIRSL